MNNGATKYGASHGSCLGTAASYRQIWNSSPGCVDKLSENNLNLKSIILKIHNVTVLTKYLQLRTVSLVFSPFSFLVILDLEGNYHGSCRVFQNREIRSIV